MALQRLLRVGATYDTWDTGEGEPGFALIRHCTPGAAGVEAGTHTWAGPCRGDRVGGATNPGLIVTPACGLRRYYFLPFDLSLVIALFNCVLAFCSDSISAEAISY